MLPWLRNLHPCTKNKDSDHEQQRSMEDEAEPDLLLHLTSILRLSDLLASKCMNLCRSLVSQLAEGHQTLLLTAAFSLAVSCIKLAQVCAALAAAAPLAGDQQTTTEAGSSSSSKGNTKSSSSSSSSSTTYVS
jgi:hypothetical protein